MNHFSLHKVKMFRNCPNPDCSAHYPGLEFNLEVPESIKRMTYGETMKVCSHCGIVWIEDTINARSRRYSILRNLAGNWLEYPWIEIYSLPKLRKRGR